MNEKVIKVFQSDFFQELKELFSKNTIGFLLTIAVLIFLMSKDVWDFIDGFITIGTVFGVWYNFMQNQKDKDKINILIRDNRGEDKEEYILPFFITRGVVSRSEIGGIIRASDENPQYKIAYFNTENYSNQLSDIQKGYKDSLIIPLKEGDIYDLIPLKDEKWDDL